MVVPRKTAKEAGDPGLVRAGKMPVRVGPAAAASDIGPGMARVEVFDRAATARAGVRGLLLRFGHTDRVERRMAVEVDYSGFRQAYGGDYGSRLTLVRLPECALTAPARRGCGAGARVPTRNAITAGLLRAEVTDGLYAVTADSEGSAGSYRPTSLSPSATWQVGLQSGDFTWSYPVPVPTLPGQVPQIDLSYNSGSVDGRVASTNNQPSWIGEGFDYQPGFVERSYRRCSEDGQAATIGDLCWASDNATVVLPGLTSELVRDAATGQWRAEQDSGWRVERLEPPGGGSNGARNGEYWRLTSPDGTQYFFGRDRLPEGTGSSPQTNSTWTVPVFGDDSGEPCHGTTFDASWCQQAYRWNLDFVIDRHGDAMSYWYAPETNYYGRNGRTELPTPYVRGGQLSRIEYGQRVGAVYTAPAAGRVVFAPADRCIPGTSCVRSQPQNWPDVPYDQWCDATSCQILSPTFWTTKRLAKITTQVVSNGAPRDVDSWTLAQSYPVPGDHTPAALWLDSITHGGLVGGNATLPAVTFDGSAWKNRVDSADALSAMYKRRIGTIYTETGGQISVTYQPTECQSGAMPAVDHNQARCFPAIWGASPREDWFHKYVVGQVVETDLVGGNPAKTTSYEYVFGGPGWHHDDAELLQDGRKSWGQWRGYQRVRVRTGEAGAPRTLTEHLFMRGMNGDVNKDGTVDQVSVDGEVDEPMWRGFSRMVTVYDGDGGPMVSRTVSQPKNLGLTAQRPRTGGTPGMLEAHLTDVEWERTETALAAGGTRTTKLDYAYDARGRLTGTHDRGDLADPGDDTCEQRTYAENTTDWVINAVARQLTLGVACDATPSYPADLISDRRYYHDGQAAWGAAPSAGDVTRVEEATSWSGGPVYATTSRVEVDGHGRPVRRYDALNHLTQTAYTPAVGGPVTRTVVTDAAGFTNTTTHEPLRGSALTAVNANGGTTTMAYDPLGRLTKVWQPGRPTSSPPNVEHSYTIGAAGPNAVLTRTLLTGDTYRASVELSDGFLRPRQTQQVSPQGGRIVTDTYYDAYGRVAAVLEPRPDPGSVATTLAPAPAVVVAQTTHEYDGAGRETASIFLVVGEPVNKWRTTTTYGGDRASVTPPAGDTARTEITDGRGRVVTLRQYTGGTPTGAYDETRYTYTKAGKLAAVTDPVGNVWRYSYDLRGRQTQAQAPDTGTTTTGYDAQGNVSTTTDARGRTLAYSYDALNRKTGMYDGSTTGAKLAEWTYDTATLGKGLPASSIRHSGGRAYENRITGYDVRGRRLATAVVVPSGETGLAGTYPMTHTYNESDQVTSVGLPAVADVPAETLQYTYDSAGLPDTLTSASTRYAYRTTYTALGEPEQYVLGPAGKQVIRDFNYEQGTRNLSVATATTSTETPLATVSYEYDPAGNVTRMNDLQMGDDQCIRYDHLRRVTEAWTGSDECSAAPSVAALAGPAPYWHSYRYDPTGNRTSEVQHAAGGDTTRTYSYPAAGAAQPHTLRSVTTAGPGGSRTDSYGYDGSGNTTTRPGAAGATQSLGWDAEGHLASATEGGSATSYLYDADGNRLIRRDPTATTLYLGDTELRIVGGVAKGTRYYQHNGEVVAVRTAGKLAWLVPDAHGTANLAVDATALVETRRYDLPFGKARGPAVTGWPGDRGFVGGTADTTGLTHLGARDYDPGAGRFVSADPVVDHQDRQQVNGYAYASNNPTTFLDADGRRVQIPAAYGSDLDRLRGKLAELMPILRLVPLKLSPTEPTKQVDNQSRAPRESDNWPDVYPYFDVYPRNYGRDVRDSRVGSCYDGDPAPAIACGYRQDPLVPKVTYQLMERDCVGWNQCISPRPYEWVPFETYDDAPAATNSGWLSRLLGSGRPGGSPTGSGGGRSGSGGTYYLG
ncbi:RHS repeat domain-containing protein [Micromonospora sp. NPDC092111]|uniref:RHS repeat domain-containing protein n=1 Tax=Micromonospora sp. NPDC092111 TaxID=3364289 RepID=UPI0038052195